MFDKNRYKCNIGSIQNGQCPKVYKHCIDLQYLQCVSGKMAAVSLAGDCGLNAFSILTKVSDKQVGLYDTSWKLPQSFADTENQTTQNIQISMMYSVFKKNI